MAPSQSSVNVRPQVTIGCGPIIAIIILLMFAGTIKSCVVDCIHAYKAPTMEAPKC